MDEGLRFDAEKMNMNKINKIIKDYTLNDEDNNTWSISSNDSYNLTSE